AVLADPDAVVSAADAACRLDQVVDRRGDAAHAPSGEQNQDDHHHDEQRKAPEKARMSRTALWRAKRPTTEKIPGNADEEDERHEQQEERQQAPRETAAITHPRRTRRRPRLALRPPGGSRATRADPRRPATRPPAAVLAGAHRGASAKRYPTP